MTVLGWQANYTVQPMLPGAFRQIMRGATETSSNPGTAMARPLTTGGGAEMVQSETLLMEIGASPEIKTPDSWDSMPVTRTSCLKVSYGTPKKNNILISGQECSNTMMRLRSSQGLTTIV